jgi:hypothetical protein
MSDLKIWKATCEIEYPAAALIFGQRGDIAAKWQWTQGGELSEWLISNNQVILHNLSRTILLTAQFKKSRASLEQPRSYRTFSKIAEDFLSSTLDSLEVKKIDKISLRIIYLAERDDFRALVHAIRRNLYKMTRAQWEPLGGYPLDVGLHLVLRLGKDRVNYQLGPMNQVEARKLFESDETKDKVPANVLYLSYDLYREKPSVGAEHRDFVSEFLASSEERIRTSAFGFVSLFGGFEK